MLGLALTAHSPGVTCSKAKRPLPSVVVSSTPRWHEDGAAVFFSEADYIRIDLVSRLRAPRQAITELETWLVENPRSPRQHEVRYRASECRWRS